MRRYRRQDTGPRSAVFTALFFVVGLCGLTGCRRATPPPPTPGWVRLGALTDVHPSRPMLDELDRRLDGLRLQREHLLAQPAFSTPPAAGVQRMPALAPLPSPAVAADPAPPTEQLNAQAKEAFRRSLTHELERKIARDERRLRDEAAAALQNELIDLAQAADAERAAIAQQDKLPLLRGELRSEMAREQIKQAEKQYQVASQSFDAAAERAKKHPKDKAAASEATRATAVRDAAALHLRNAQERARAITEAYVADQTAYRDAIQQVDVRLDAALLRARQRQAATITERVTALRAEMRTELERGVAAHEARFSADAPRDHPGAPSPPLTFTALPDDALVLPLPGLDRSFGAVNGDSRARDATEQAIDRTIETVQRERDKVHALIERDTRAAAAAVARYHGYEVTFQRGNGKEITGQVRRWLRDYWPSVP